MDISDTVREAGQLEYPKIIIIGFIGLVAFAMYLFYLLRKTHKENKISLVDMQKVLADVNNAVNHKGESEYTLRENMLIAIAKLDKLERGVAHIGGELSKIKKNVLENNFRLDILEKK